MNDSLNRKAINKRYGNQMIDLVPHGRPRYLCGGSISTY